MRLLAMNRSMSSYTQLLRLKIALKRLSDQNGTARDEIIKQSWNFRTIYGG
jgi:hypothetical protein